MPKHWHRYVIGIICVVFFAIPFFSSAGYSLGGDDARLYYLYPKEYLQSYLFNSMSTNGMGGNMGYAAVSYTAPLISIFFLIKTVFPMINIQHVFYGANLSLGFLFTYVFFRILGKTKKATEIYSAILASCLYVTSLYLSVSLYQFELIVISLVMFTPIFFWLFLMGLEQKNMSYIVGAALVTAIMSTSLYALPWFLPVVIVFSPYILYCVFRYGWYFWKALIVFILLSVGLNWYWMVHGVISLFSSQSDTTLASLVSSKQFIQDAENTIYSSAFLNGPLHQIAGYIRTSWTDYRPMPFLSLIGMSALVLVSLAGMKLKTASKYMQTAFGVLLIPLVIAFYTITPNMGKWNMDLFLFWNRTVPMFSMFRNTTSKFGLAMAFASACMVFLSLSILTSQKRAIWKWIAFLLGASLLVYQLPSFFVVQGIGVSKPRFHEVSADYQQLVRYVSNMDTTKRFVWFPMTFPGYTPIEDAIDKNAWYLGLSPLQILAQKSDLAGFYGIQTSVDPYRNWRILDLLKEKQYDEVVSLLAGNNVGYIIVINKPLPDAVRKQLDLFSFMAFQTDAYKQALLGEKVADIGDAYSIYRLHPQYDFDTVFLSNNPADIRAGKEAVSFREVKPNVYDVTIPAATDAVSLVLLTPYHTLWDISTDEQSGFSFTNHRSVYGYGNVWDIQKSGESTAPVAVRIAFVPERFTMPSLGISIVVFVGCIIYLAYPKRKKNHI